MNAVTIRNVVKTYNDNKKTVKALDNISFDIKEGEVFGLLGANGAGKTTLISIMNGLVSKDRGKIHLLGEDLDNGLDKVKPYMNLVTGFTMLGTPFSIREYLRYFSLLYGVKDKSRIEYVIDLFELKSVQKKQINELSSGYKQRVLFAKAMLNKPKLIFMDEPTVGLDVRIALKIRNLIKELKKEKTTIIFTSHNLNEVEQLCDRIAVIVKGKLLKVGSIEEIKKDVKTNRLFEIECKDYNGLLNEISRWDGIIRSKLCSEKIIVELAKDKDITLFLKKLINTRFFITSIRRIEPSLEEAFLNSINGAINNENNTR